MTTQDHPERSVREEPDADKRRVAERLLPELIKRIVEVGAGKLAEGPESLRHLVSELRLPKDISGYLLSQIDETKNGLYRVVAKEIRDFLEHTNLSDEVTRALTKVSFEIRTEIRFVPNADPDQRLFPKPDVKADVTVHRDRDEGSKSTVEGQRTRGSRDAASKTAR